ncbi:MAG TPA: MG2 domain-containing protein, partial [Chthoniobacterales bacterium]|nr:MG2 domain-containing protein [Chthoniobacterales bacterium]
ADDPTKRDRTFRPWQSDDKTLTIWGEDPPAPTEPDEEDEVESGDAAPKPIPKRGNLLFVAPVKPLPPGKDWRLVLEAGLPSTQWKAALPSRQEIRFGAVKPFVVASVAAEANRTEGRRLVVELSKPLAEEVTAENIGRWMKVEPAPEKLRAQVEGSFVTWRGEFALGQQYRLTVAAGLPAREPVATDKPFTKEVAFQKIAPRLYFQDFAVHQYARGSRELRLLSLNIPRVRVVAKLFTGAAIPAALKAYDKYMEQGEEQMEVDEMFARVDPAALPGEEIWTKEMAVGGEVDSQQMLSFSWDEIVGQNRTGVVMLTAESIDPVLANGKRVGTQTIIQLTDIGAIWKRDREGVLLHVFSLATGKKLPAAQLRLLDREAGHLGEAVTDEQGNARIKLPDEARWVSIRTGDDTHVISVYDSENSLPLYRLGVTEESSDNDDAFARSIFLFTERGVYKPGDKVHLKGYARDPRDNQPQTPAGKTVTVKVTDAKERQIASSEVTLSDYGSFDQEIALPDGSLGRYRVTATGQEGDRLGGTCYFQVQEYRPNAFEIMIPAPPQSTGSTQLDLPISAKYFMGKPLSEAKLTWSLVGRDERFAPDGLSEFVFTNGIDGFRLNRALDRISQLNAQGDT